MGAAHRVMIDVSRLRQHYLGLRESTLAGHNLFNGIIYSFLIYCRKLGIHLGHANCYHKSNRGMLLFIPKCQQL